MAHAKFRVRAGRTGMVSSNLEEAKPKAGSPRRPAEDGGKRTEPEIETQKPRWTSAIDRFCLQRG